MVSRGLPLYELSGKAQCAYFTLPLVGTEKVAFKESNGKTSRRQLVGCRRRRDGSTGQVAQRYWHFAIQARPLFYPRLAYAVRTHVLFSSDGEDIWSSKGRLHRARRSACRQWWNDVWRDRMLASMSWLADGGETFRVPLSPSIALEVAAEPVRFQSPVSYLEPEYEELEDEAAEERDEDDEEIDDEADGS